MEKQKYPEVRFKGYDQNWRLKKLEAIGIFNPYSNLPQEFEYVDLESVVGTELINSRKETIETAPSRAQRLASRGDVFYQAVRPYQKNNYLFDLPYDNYVFSTGYIQIRPTINSYYLLTFVQKNDFVQKVLENCTGTSYPAINTTGLKSIDVFISNEADEQTQIGNFFQNLDQSIALHEKKLAQTQNLKKAMLEKMFPKAGSTQPEIRLKGFSGEWEQRKLGDISEIKTGPFGSTLHADDYVNNGTPIVTTEHFKSGELPEQTKGIPQVSESDFCRLNNYILKTDDIVFSRVGSVDINALVTSFQAGWLFSGRVLRVRSYDYVWSSFLHYELSTERAKNDVIIRAVGQTMPSINTEILKITKVYLPKSKVEQIQIGQFFKQLDETLVLQQQQLQTLKNLKQAFLEKMFV
ncbi:restriction endonuclease subunit S [Acinetobacter soli]|uniref:restriction endonuclease subunit S n=1 Tax=Acinetobacter soli TaxID=487316 RepID=UPI0013C2A260|nr:restriction endonuclease subunit S [Acinetobacter soli]